MTTAVKITDLNEIAERTGIADNYYSLKHADLGLTPAQAFALAWYTVYETQPDLLKRMALPATKTACAQLLGISRVTLDKWLNDERLAVSGVQRVVDSWLPGLLFKSFDRLKRIIDGDSKDSDANYAIRTVLDYDAARRGTAGPGVQVNVQINNHLNQTLTRIYGDNHGND